MNSQGTSEFEPSVNWSNEEDCNTLLLYLPGFVKEQLRVQLRSRTLIISGERRLDNNTRTRFRKEFLVSEDCDVNKISAKFEGSILSIKQPKSTTAMAKQEENTPMNAVPRTPENPMDELRDHHEERAQVKTESKPTSLTQFDGEFAGVKNRKERISDEKVGELMDPEGVCENASKKNAGGSEFAMKMRPSRYTLVKVLVLVVGFVMGVYCTRMIESWIG